MTTWAFTAPLSLPRAFQTATLLPTGKVLIAGGATAAGGETDTATAELYNPATGSLTSTGTMNTPRDQHTATLLPTGKVLIAGGAPCQGCYPLATAELYDPATGTFTPTGSMHTIQALATATLLRSGLVLIAGGANGQNGGQIGGAVSNAELYNPWTGRFTATASMNEARDVHTATRLPDGSVLVAGGCSDPSGHCNPPISATAEVFK